MATASRQARYAQKRADVVRKLLERGSVEKFAIRKSGHEPYNPDDKALVTFEAPVFPLTWDQDFSNDVRADDLMFIVGADVDLTECRMMLFEGHEYMAKKIKPFKVDGITMFYEIQVRG